MSAISSASRRYRYGVGEEEDQIGAVTGLAWTEVGGELLTIEAVTVPGKGAIKTTGKLGEVMTESIATAMSFVKARSPSYGVKPSMFSRKDIHVHLPEGAVPKDGPSAGIGMVTAMISTLTATPVRRDVAMTGEVTLRGRVLPIGGLKEKLLAALRGGIKTVFIPAENEKDLAEIPGLGEGRAGNRPRRACRRGAGAGAEPAADGDRMDRCRRAGDRADGSSAGQRSTARQFVIEGFDFAAEPWLNRRRPAPRESRSGLTGSVEGMNKQELIGHVADRAGLSRNDAARAIETMLEVVTATLKRGDEVRLVGFGNFSVTRRKASTGRNPRTGEPMQIKASSQPKFRPGKVLKDAVQ